MATTRSNTCYICTESEADLKREGVVGQQRVLVPAMQADAAAADPNKDMGGSKQWTCDPCWAQWEICKDERHKNGNDAPMSTMLDADLILANPDARLPCGGPFDVCLCGQLGAKLAIDGCDEITCQVCGNVYVFSGVMCATPRVTSLVLAAGLDWSGADFSVLSVDQCYELAEIAFRNGAVDALRDIYCVIAGRPRDEEVAYYEHMKSQKTPDARVVAGARIVAEQDPDDDVVSSMLLLLLSMRKLEHAKEVHKLLVQRRAVEVAESPDLAESKKSWEMIYFNGDWFVEFTSCLQSFGEHDFEWVPVYEFCIPVAWDMAAAGKRKVASTLYSLIAADNDHAGADAVLDRILARLRRTCSVDFRLEVFSDLMWLCSLTCFGAPERLVPCLRRHFARFLVPKNLFKMANKMSVAAFVRAMYRFPRGSSVVLLKDCFLEVPPDEPARVVGWVMTTPLLLADFKWVVQHRPADVDGAIASVIRWRLISGEQNSPHFMNFFAAVGDLTRFPRACEAVRESFIVEYNGGDLFDAYLHAAGVEWSLRRAGQLMMARIGIGPVRSHRIDTEPYSIAHLLNRIRPDWTWEDVGVSRADASIHFGYITCGADKCSSDSLFPPAKKIKLSPTSEEEEEEEEEEE